MKNYYEILGIEEEATQEEIRARWDELTKLYHPDVLQSPEADDRIKEINEAYQVLKDYSTRLEYDLERALRRLILKKADERKRKRVRLGKILLPVGLGAILVVIGTFVFFSKSPQVFHGRIKITIPETARVVEPEVPKKLEESKKPEKPEKRKEPEKPVEVAKVVPREPVKVVVPEPPKVVEPKKPEERKKLDKPKKREKPKKPVEVTKVLPREPVKVVVPEPPKVVEPEKPKEPEKPTPSREEEVEKFFADFL